MLLGACNGLALPAPSSPDVNPLAMPEVGSSGLRVLSPTILELSLVNTKAAGAPAVATWDFVGPDFQLQAPGAEQFSVTVDGQPVAVQRVGFKRRPIYAPLKPRDLRIGNWIYLELASAVAEEQTVEVTNPGGELWTPDKPWVAKAEPLRWSPAIHVNQVGYQPVFSKRAMVGYFLGSLGELVVPPDRRFQIVDDSGAMLLRVPGLAA